MAQYPYGLAWDHLASGTSQISYALGEYLISYAAAGGGFDSSGGRIWLRLSGQASFVYLDPVILMPGTTGLRMAFRYQKVGSSTNMATTFSFRNSTNGTVFSMKWWFNGTLSFYRGATLLGSANIPTTDAHISLSVWNDNSDGRINVAIDGTEVLALSGIDNIDQTGPVTNMSTTVTENATNDNYIRVCDFLVGERAAQGTVNYFAPLKANRTKPTSDVGTPGFTRNTGSSNASAVGETSCDSDTTYNEANTVNAEDQFEHEDLAGTVTNVQMVSIVVVAKAPNGGAPPLGISFEENSTKVFGSTQNIGNTSYRTYQSMFYTAPDASGLTPTKYNSSRIGYKAL